jgi:hypothetical protein
MLAERLQSEALSNKRHRRAGSPIPSPNSMEPVDGENIPPISIRNRTYYFLPVT